MLLMKNVHCHNHKLKASFLFITLFLLATVCSCGGGSGGSSTASGITYVGNTSPANIDTVNAREVAADAYKGGQTGETMNPFTTLQVSAVTSAPGRPLAIDLYEMFEENLVQADIPEQTGFSVSAAVTESDTLPDECGGSGYASYSITYDEQTGAFSGNFAYHDFCSESGTYSGSASFSGVVNTAGTDGEFFTYFGFTFNNLTVNSDGTAYTMHGELQFAANSGNPTVTLDLLVQNNVSGEVAWIDDYTLTYDDQNVDISGSYYHPVHGRVTIETEQSLHFDSGEEYPSSGAMVFIGAIGSQGGNTRVRIQAVSSTNCQVTADTDGDGAYDDFDSGEIAWAALDA